MIRKKQKNSFLDLSIREQKKIIKGAAKEANKKQRELVERYEQKFGSSKQSCEFCVPE